MLALSCEKSWLIFSATPGEEPLEENNRTGTAGLPDITTGLYVATPALARPVDKRAMATTATKIALSPRPAI